MVESGCAERSKLLVCVDLGPVVRGGEQGIDCGVTLHFKTYIVLAVSIPRICLEYL